MVSAETGLHCGCGSAVNLIIRGCEDHSLLVVAFASLAADKEFIISNAPLHGVQPGKLCIGIDTNWLTLFGT